MFAGTSAARQQAASRINARMPVELLLNMVAIGVSPLLHFCPAVSAARYWELVSRKAASRLGTIVPTGPAAARVPVRPAKVHCPERAAPRWAQGSFQPPFLFYDGNRRHLRRVGPNLGEHG